MVVLGMLYYWVYHTILYNFDDVLPLALLEHRTCLCASRKDARQ